MSVSNLGNFPLSYRDPMYATLARTAEAKYGLPTGILDAIRLRGERSNADQISSAGAETPYPFIPSTRQGMINNYGTDPWADAPSATDAAAQLLAQNHNRAGGSWDKAIAMYSGVKMLGPAAFKYNTGVGKLENVRASATTPTLCPLPNGVDTLT